MGAETQSVQYVTPKVKKKKVEEKLIFIPGISRGRIHSMGYYVVQNTSLCSKEHPLQVKVGKYEVFTIGKFDYKESKHFNIMKDLDVFFGLDRSWESLEVMKSEYKNPFIQAIYDKMYGHYQVLDNLIATHIPDRGIDIDVYKIIRQTLVSGKKVGFGCQAGHGRTGWVLAKLIKSIEKCSGDEAVRRTRKRYCQKCVESEVQRTDLGCKAIVGSDPKPNTSVSKTWRWDDKQGKLVEVKRSKYYMPVSSSTNPYRYEDDYWKHYTEVGNKPMSTREEWFGDVSEKALACVDCKKSIEECNESCENFNHYSECAKCEKSVWECKTCPSNQELFLDETVEDEENRDLVEETAKRNLANIGYVDPIDEEETKEIQIGTLTKVYQKWMKGEELTVEEMDLLDKDFKKGKKNKGECQ